MNPRALIAYSFYEWENAWYETKSETTKLKEIKEKKLWFFLYFKYLKKKPD